MVEQTRVSVFPPVTTLKIAMVDSYPSDVKRVLLATPVSAVALPDSTYQRWMSEARAETSIFSAPLSLLPINPRATYQPTCADYGEGSRALGLTRWELGGTPTGLIHAFGLSELVIDFVVGELVPRCVHCNCSMKRPRGAKDLSLPTGGYLLATPAEDAENVSLREQCEMLGSERALVSAKIVRADSIAQERGAPIVSVVSAQDAEQLHEAIANWFARGGGALALHHAATRESDVVWLDNVSRHWVCGTCATRVEPPSRRRLVDLAACRVCRGAGWLLERDGRLAACRECDGFGSDDEIGQYEVNGVALCRLAEVSFSDLRVMVEQGGSLQRRALLAALAQIEEFGFGGYPLASPSGTLSDGERVLATALIGRLSCIVGARYVVDGAYLREESLISLSENARDSLRIVVPERRELASPKILSTSSAESIRLRGIGVGTLRIAEVEFPLGALSIIEGIAGAGKSLLLAEIARRFSRRKKLAHAASFGGLKRCHLIGVPNEPTGSLLSLLSLDSVLAEEIAATRAAQLEGITVEDLSRVSARYRCDRCDGLGVVPRVEDSPCLKVVICDECEGALYDWRVADLPLLGGTVAGVLQTPLAECARLLWRDPSVSAALARVADGFERVVSLSTPESELSAEERGFAALAARLVRIGAAVRAKRAQSKSLAEQLVLVDGPRTLTGRHFGVIRDLLRDLVDSGATIIYADPPWGLEYLAASVLRLRAVREASVSQERRSFADTRFARISVIGRNEA